MENRVQGRPRYGVSVGRDKIVETLRTQVRFARSFDTSRKALARYAGVTPALITYYFPKNEDVLDAVVKPIVEKYAAEMRRIIDGSSGFSDRLKLLIKLLTRLYVEDAVTMQLYKDRSSAEPDAPNCIDDMTESLRRFFSGRNGDADVDLGSSFDAAVFHGAIRGMCEFVARASASAPADVVTEQMEHALYVLAARGSASTVYAAAS